MLSGSGDFVQPVKNFSTHPDSPSVILLLTSSSVGCSMLSARSNRVTARVSPVTCAPGATQVFSEDATAGLLDSRWMSCLAVDDWRLR